MKPKPNSPPRLLSMARVAELSNVSVRTVSRWIKTGELHAHKLGRQVRVSEEDFMYFIAARRG